MAFHVDTSALVRLLVAEAETEALISWLGQADHIPVSCDLARTELTRAVRRAVPDRVVREREVLDSITLVEVTASTLDAAGRLDPITLRTLDAVHLIAALSLGDDLEGIVTYDERLGDAAGANGVAVTSPT